VTLATISAIDPLAAFAIGRTLPLEGGLVNAAGDPGSITDHGISLRFALAQAALDPAELPLFDIDHDGHVTGSDIAGLTTAEASEIYDRCFWAPGFYAKLTPALLAWKCFDIAVNTGPKRSAMILQAALRSLGVAVRADGVVGAVTIAAVAAEAAKDQGGALLAAIRREQAEFYRSLVSQKPALKVFLKGWLNRAAA
jgi:lysozyme family protein